MLVLTLILRWSDRGKRPCHSIDQPTDQQLPFVLTFYIKAAVIKSASSGTFELSYAEKKVFVVMQWDGGGWQSTFFTYMVGRDLLCRTRTVMVIFTLVSFIKSWCNLVQVCVGARTFTVDHRMYSYSIIKTYARSLALICTSFHKWCYNLVHYTPHLVFTQRHQDGAEHLYRPKDKVLDL